jgi:hypothetical protein
MPEDENHEWARLGLDKRVDYENLKRVFERLDLKVLACVPVFFFTIDSSTWTSRKMVKSIPKNWKLSTRPLATNLEK